MVRFYIFFFFCRWFFWMHTHVYKQTQRMSSVLFTVILRNNKKKTKTGRQRGQSSKWRWMRERKRGKINVWLCTCVSDLKSKKEMSWVGAMTTYSDSPLSCLLLQIPLCFCHAYCRAKFHSLYWGKKLFSLHPILKESESLEKVTVGRLQ